MGLCIGAAALQNSEIAVDNHKFSTFSTGFSTSLFHRFLPAVLCILVYIIVLPFFHKMGAKNYDRKMPKASPLPSKNNLDRLSLEKAGNILIFPEIFLKRGLILERNHAIMCSCMN